MTTLMIVYAALYNSCTYESDADVLSLHTTKAGAWKVVHAHKWASFQEARDLELRFGRYGVANDYNQSWEWWGIRSYDVLDDYSAWV